MNKFIPVVVLLALVALSAYEASPSESLLSHWTSFKAQHGKRYSGPAEEAKRLELLTQNTLKVEQFNEEQSKEAGFRLAVNHLSDKTDDEFKQLLGFKMSSEQLKLKTSEKAAAFLEKILAEADSKELPKEVDWRKAGRVSSVKNQGQCGSCWAFSTVGVLEGQEKTAKNISKAISLSPQNIMDCGSFASAPCNGGNMATALDDVADQGGIESEDNYPYETRGDSCKFNKTLSVIVNTGSLQLPATDEENLKKVVATYGPVSVAIEVSDKGNFRHYESGVYTDESCHNSPSYLNHGVLVVGYGTDKEGGDYWIVKNSWAATWGDEGYIKMARGKNLCGIAYFPIVASFD